MRAAFVQYKGATGAAGGLVYDRLLVDGLRSLGSSVDEVDLPWYGFGYARGIASNALPLPRELGGYDFVLQDEMVHATMVLRNSLLHAAGVPIVSIVHNLTSSGVRLQRRWLALEVERAYLRSVDAVVAVCQSTRHDVERLRCAGEPTLVAYAGRDHMRPDVDAELIATRAAARGPLRVLFVGVVAPHKGLDRLLHALAGLGTREVTLDVAGSLGHAPAYTAAIERQITELGLQASVRLHGKLQSPELHALYRGSHLFALSSDQEAYSLSALDALGFGLPALLPAFGGSSEMITSGVEGHLLAPDDIAAWTRAIAGFADDRARLLTFGRAALSRHRAHGTWSDTAARVQAFCAELPRKAR